MGCVPSFWEKAGEGGDGLSYWPTDDPRLRAGFFFQNAQALGLQVLQDLVKL